MSKAWATFIVLVAIVSIVFNWLLYSRYSTTRPIVRYNDDAITRKQYLDTMEYQYGKSVLSKMLFSRIVLQAAAKENLVPTPQDVDGRLAEINRRTPQMTAAAGQDPTKMSQLRDDLKADMALENLRMQGVSVTDADIEAFYLKNKNAFILPPQVDTIMVLAQNSVDSETAATDLQQGLSADVIARQPRLRVLGVNGVKLDLRSLSPQVNRAITQAISKMKLNEIKTLHFEDMFLTIKVIKSAPGGLPPIEQVKDQVTRTLKLSKSPSMQIELATLYRASRPRFDVDKYHNYFTEIETFDIDAAERAAKQFPKP